MFRHTFQYFLSSFEIDVVSFFIPQKARSTMEICDCYSKPARADIHVIQKYGFYWILFYLLLLVLYEAIGDIPFEDIYIFISTVMYSITCKYVCDALNVEQGQR